MHLSPVHEEILFAPCIFHLLIYSGKHNIRWLGEEALRRYLKLRPPSFVPNREERVHDIRKTVGGAILDPEDAIGAVLNDNDFVSIGNYAKLLLTNHSLFESNEIPNFQYLKPTGLILR